MSKNRTKRCIPETNGKISAYESELSQLYYTIFDDLINYGLKFVKDIAIVEDAIQEIFVDLLQNKKKYTKINNPKYYIFKSVKYIIIKDAEQKSGHSPLSQLYHSPAVYPFENEIIEKEKTSYRNKIIDKALKELSHKEKESIYLKYICGLNYHEIAGIMNIKTETSRTLIYRAIKKIRKQHHTKDLLRKINLFFLL